MPALLSAAVLLGCYLLFAGQASAAEIVAGLCSAALATTYAVLASRSAPRRFAPGGAPWLRVVGTPLMALPRDAVRVGGALLRAVARRPEGAIGQAHTLSFREGADDAGDAARRGLVVLGLSFAPNGYVLRLRTGDRLRLHVLAGPPPAPGDRDWPL